jgi:hypothetical protein
MPERPNPSAQLPGYSAPWAIPGQAKNLAARAQAGRGELAAEQAEANRVFRTREADEYTAPLPRRVESLDAITAGLGLDRVTEARVLKMIEEQGVAYQTKGQTQRVFLAVNALTESLRRIHGVPSDARMEIAKRARAFWRNTQPTDYAKEPTVRAPQRPQMRSDTLITAKSGVRFIIRDPLRKAKSKTMPESLNVTPTDGAGEGALKGASTPPAGFSPIPHSRKGGFRKRGADGWIYWYPGAGITSTAHPDDAGGARAKRAADATAVPRKPGKGAGQGQEGPLAPHGASQKLAGGPPPPQVPGEPPKAAGGPQGAFAQVKPHVQKDAHGEKRVFHPQVWAYTPAGKEDDHEHHAAEFRRHRTEKSKAMRMGDAEKAKAHTYAMNYHADKHNRLLAQMQGKVYKPKKDYPGADAGDDEASSAVESQHERAMGKDEQQSRAAEPRERFVPESESVRGMREKIGKVVNIMADLSQAYDHLSSLRAKRLEVKRSGHPLARRMVAQIDAEIAATKHDIVQLEDAHQLAMKEVAAQQVLLRNERIRANPIFQAFMAAMAKLSTLGEKAGKALEGVRQKKSKIAVEKSMHLVKSAEWREVLKLAPKLDATLRKSVPVHYVAPMRHVARAPMTFLDLYGV